MRARREVAHFGHTILRDGGLPGDDTDDANDEDDDEDEEEDSEPDDVMHTTSCKRLEKKCFFNRYRLRIEVIGKGVEMVGLEARSREVRVYRK